MSSRATSPTKAAARLYQSTSKEVSTPRASGGRSISGHTKASTIGGTHENDGDADSSDIDEADFGMETLANYQETTAEKTRMKILLDSFNQGQMARYEVFRRVKLNTLSVKRLANAILSQTLPQNIAVVIAGSGKVFVSEIVERARHVQRIREQSGPLTPEHLREAYRQYKVENGLVSRTGRRILR
ncbi:Transcription initiation factor TFIID subunit 11 [Taphrina deformans PYCC 5710]|uniref:Transcription initiation factor TFIID subunit 11 n=1 Tax=Taphrina deformans (strain PYCC 5710 / ATCC 11124 / CBS 356.35 / IMI 108563 / JCM 9778 / NBRC 8474) TaxID=1097556 RepID=R4XFB3_TAPDE|nr:Transcription initiation factor TFIID subunit 11 [Taphrina deformans PYCC 5710]|eukprot:CCG83131.1 Transcription initiation factor TFIID subunit 11 [Taphrina deformans PYCC 5710]